MATMAVNARGPFLINCLHDVPTRDQEIALRGVHCGAAVALATAQVQTGYDLLSMEPSFPMADDLDMHEELIEDFGDAAAEIVDIISDHDVVNRVFD